MLIVGSVILQLLRSSDLYLYRDFSNSIPYPCHWKWVEIKDRVITILEIYIQIKRLLIIVTILIITSVRWYYLQSVIILILYYILHALLDIML